MPRSPSRLLILVLCLPLLAACAKGITPQQDAELRAVYEKMRVNDLGGIESQFAPERRQPTLHQGLQFMQGMIPPDKPAVHLLKGLVLDEKGGAIEYGGLYEYDYASTAVLAQIDMRQDNAGHKAITAVHLQQAPAGISHAFDFNLSGKKYYQYIFLFLMALSPAFGVWGLAALYFARDLKWRFFWILAMLLGFMDLKMDWRTGDIVLNVAYVHPFWIFASKFGPLSPWMLSTSLPVASIAFLLGYRRLERPWDGPKKR
jgi:hypothetical protein